MVGWSGDGTYTTSNDGATEVWVSTDGSQGTSSTLNQTIPEHPCTITVASNFEDVVVPASGDAQLLDIELSVSCPNGPGDGGICAIECAATPPSFELAVAGCTVSQ